MIFHEAGKKTEKAGKPQIRFVGFVDEWEQCKFSELVLIERGGSPRPIDDYITDEPNGLNWVKIGDAPTQGHYITKTVEKIKLEGLPRTRQVQPGDLILSNSMSFGKPYIMAINGCIHDGWLLIRDINNIFDLTFLCHLLGTTQMLEQYKQFAAGSTVNNLNKELVGNTIVSIPAKQEQRVLGKYFEQLDHFITLYQSKYDKLIDMKKAMLEKMFPKDGEAVPEIRFREFSDNWEQHKLGNIANITKLAGFEFTEYIVYSDEGNIIALRGLNVKSGNLVLDDVKYIDNSDFSKLGRSKLYVDDVLFTYVGTIGELAIILENNKFYLAPNVSRIRFEKKYFASFMIQQMGSKSFYDKMIFSLIATSSQPALSMENIRKFVIKVPQNIAEQKAIGQFFSDLNRLITLHQHKLEKLKNLKKAFLEKMFI